MNKTELVVRLAKKQPHLTIKDARFAINIILKMIREGLNTSNRIEIRGFGVFSLRFRPSRVRISLKSGQELHFPAHYAFHFKPAKALKLRVNQTVQKSQVNPSNLRPGLHKADRTEKTPKPMSAIN